VKPHEQKFLAVDGQVTRGRAPLPASSLKIRQILVAVSLRTSGNSPSMEAQIKLQASGTIPLDQVLDEGWIETFTATIAFHKSIYWTGRIPLPNTPGVTIEAFVFNQTGSNEECLLQYLTDAEEIQ